MCKLLKSCLFFSNVSVDVPSKSLYAFVFVVPAGSPSLSAAKWKVSTSAPLTQLALPEAATFQLIGDETVTQVNCHKFPLPRVSSAFKTSVISSASAFL